MAPTATEVAWAAGLFEGEGCVGVSHPSRSPSPSVQLGMTDFDTVERFAAVVGFGKTWRRERPPYKPVLAWHSQGFEHVQALVAMFWPWLGARRRARAVEVLTAAKVGTGVPWAQRTHCPQGHPYDETNTRRYGPDRRWRSCRRCQADRNRKRRERKVA